MAVPDLPDPRLRPHELSELRATLLSWLSAPVEESEVSHLQLGQELQSDQPEVKEHADGPVLERLSVHGLQPGRHSLDLPSTAEALELGMWLYQGHMFFPVWHESDTE